MRKISPLHRELIVELVASRYTDWAILAPRNVYLQVYIKDFWQYTDKLCAEKKELILVGKQLDGQFLL
jgi:hypothetical protein